MGETTRGGWRHGTTRERRNQTYLGDRGYIVSRRWQRSDASGLRALCVSVVQPLSPGLRLPARRGMENGGKVISGRRCKLDTPGPESALGGFGGLLLIAGS